MTRFTVKQIRIGVGLIVVVLIVVITGILVVQLQQAKKANDAKKNSAASQYTNTVSISGTVVSIADSSLQLKAASFDRPGEFDSYTVLLNNATTYQELNLTRIAQSGRVGDGDQKTLTKADIHPDDEVTIQAAKTFYPAKEFIANHITRTIK